MGAVETGTLHHTCFVVRDLETTARMLADSLGVSWGVWTITPGACTVHGRDVPYSFRVAVAQAGGANFELIEPAGGESVYVEHLAEKGEGFHHTCLIYPDREALRAAKEELLDQGRALIQTGEIGDAGEFCYFEMPEMNGALELLCLAELPPPELTIG